MVVIVSSNKVIAFDREFTWEELVAKTVQRLGELAPLRKRRIMFVVSDELDAVSLVATGIQAELDFGVIDSSRLNTDLKKRLLDDNILVFDMVRGAEIIDAKEGMEVRLGRISVLTSGTTGLPKLIAHSAGSLNTFVRLRNLESHRWFVPYQVGSYAWYQMVSLGLFVEGQELVLASAQDLMGSFEAALQSNNVTAVSSTPTFWRQAAMSVAPMSFKASAIRSISLGGEIVDQPILDYLLGTFPSATIKHIYASSEVGAAIVVSDGKAGFDASLLREDRNKSVSVRIVDGKLNVLSRYGNSDASGTWIDTGDLVEQISDRVYFRGRANNQMINVGGQKAFPAAIEAQLLAHPDVVWAQVVAKRAPLVGYLPVANLVLKAGIEPDKAEIDLTRFCEARLPEYAVPRLWNFLDAVPLRASLKS